MNPVAQHLPVQPAGLGGGLAVPPPSITSAIASMRLAAFASFAFDAEARSSRAERSIRVIVTAIETSMLRWQ